MATSYLVIRYIKIYFIGMSVLLVGALILSACGDYGNPTPAAVQPANQVQNQIQSKELTEAQHSQSNPVTGMADTIETAPPYPAITPIVPPLEPTVAFQAVPVTVYEEDGTIEQFLNRGGQYTLTVNSKAYLLDSPLAETYSSKLAKGQYIKLKARLYAAQQPVIIQILDFGLRGAAQPQPAANPVPAGYPADRPGVKETKPEPKNEKKASEDSDKGNGNKGGHEGDKGKPKK